MRPPEPGRPIIAASWVSVVLFAVVAVPRALGADALDVVVVAVSLTEFFVSLPVWVYALVVAAARTAPTEDGTPGDDVTLSGLFFLSGSAPRAIRVHLLGALAAVIVLVALTATSEPFVVLVPMLQLGLVGLWGARHGTYPPRAAVRPGGRQ